MSYLNSYYTTFSSDLLRTKNSNNCWYHPESRWIILIIRLLIELIEQIRQYLCVQILQDNILLFSLLLMRLLRSPQTTRGTIPSYRIKRIFSTSQMRSRCAHRKCGIHKNLSELHEKQKDWSSNSN